MRAFPVEKCDNAAAFYAQKMLHFRNVLAVKNCAIPNVARFHQFRWNLIKRTNLLWVFCGRASRACNALWVQTPIERRKLLGRLKAPTISFDVLNYAIVF